MTFKKNHKKYRMKTPFAVEQELFIFTHWQVYHDSTQTQNNLCSQK